MSDVFKVLSIDGGGIRGIIPALFLAEIEARTGQRVADLFDLIVGTSTGGILALGLVTPDANGRPKYSAADGAAIYGERGAEIFSTSVFRRQVGQLFDERYPSAGVERVLRQHFEDKLLKDALKPVVITSYDIESHEPRFFKSRRADDQKRLMWQLARSTSAAPSFFEPFTITDPDYKYGDLIDGGVFANNPAMCAYAEAIKHHEANNVIMVSLGTGEFTQKTPLTGAKDWGLIEWARPVIDIIMSGMSYTVDYQMKQLLSYMDEGEAMKAGQTDEADTTPVIPRYFRFQVELTDETMVPMDNSDDINVDNLKGLAQKMINDN
jgi:patatin-like phospholipase/acyl hydrolase